MRNRPLHGRRAYPLGRGLAAFATLMIALTAFIVLPRHIKVGVVIFAAVVCGAATLILCYLMTVSSIRRVPP